MYRRRRRNSHRGAAVSRRRGTAIEAAHVLQPHQPGAKILIAAIVTFAMLMPSHALAQPLPQPKPVDPRGSCPQGDTSSDSFCIGAGATAAPNGEGYDLHFENVPVATLAKIILGYILGVGYMIDPRVQGTVSLASGRPVPKSDILFVLEDALRLSNVALVRDAFGYRLMPVGEAIGTGHVDGLRR